MDNGINIEQLNRILNGYHVKSKSRFTVFTVGRICNQKNPKLFNKIAELLPDIKFLWIGDGELRSELTASNIEVTGWVEREEALEFALTGDVFILTSLWEGLPMALLEAMYMKKICIVSNVVGNRDVIKSGINGYVCSCIDDFCKAIKSAKNRDCSHLTDKAYKDIVEIYNTKIMAQKYNSIYIEKMRKVK